MNPVTLPPVALSVIIPTYRGAERIEGALSSLASQTLDATMFEVVVIVNGPREGYVEALEGMAERHPGLRLRVEFSDRTGASHARNIGLAISSGRYVTFVDDDDWLQPRFLELGLAAAGVDRVVVLPLIDQLMDTDELRPSPYGTQTRAADAQVVPLATQHWILMFNACKILPRDVAVQIRYDEDLRSGEDLVYFSHLLAHELLVAFTYGDDAHYVRRVRAGSISRQNTSFDFLVTQRLACIQRLDGLDLPVGSVADDSRMLMIRSQANSLVRWLDGNPEGRARVMAAVNRANIQRFPRGLFNKGQAEELAFLPTFGLQTDADAAGELETLVARGAVVDVISAVPPGPHPQNPHALVLVADVLDTHTGLAVPWGEDVSECVTAFALSAARTAARRHGRKPYRSLYSRAPWASSHAAGALFKLDHWPIVWTAEFSHSLRTTPEGAKRPSPIVWDDVTATFRAAIDARGFEALRIPTTFALIEAVTVIVADEVVFPTPHIRDEMLAAWGDSGLTELVMAKSTARTPRWQGYPSPAP
ncbi:glycosyltransferase family 2 protein [Tessaracoccus antarcticus]|uniref:glycosyltransferase family 2 protein n=1 Tax=Tessaracoccus antarcticus TaxID=2479848 RepID=UPI0013146D94|nr:glycosyltransferase family A protein [Tessaracoccus antarcticus]